MLAIYIIWGSTYLAIRFAVATIPPFLMGATRFLVAGGLLYLFRRSRGDPVPSQREWRGAGIAGLFLLTLGNGGVAWAEQRIPSGAAALLIGTTPLWFVLLDWLRPGGKWPGWPVLLSVLVGFAGIILLVGPGQLSGSAQLDLIGTAAVIFATVAWAAGSIYGRSAVFPASPLMGTAAEMLVGGMGLLVLGTMTGEWSRLNLSQVAPSSLWGLAYLIVFGSWVAFSAYVWLLRVAPTPLVATYAYVNPVVAVFLGSVIANEPLYPRTLLAAAIIIGSVILTTLARRLPRKMTEPSPVKQ
jgi:drug/metabolite transporter (DMT)-like permease